MMYAIWDMVGNKWLQHKSNGGLDDFVAIFPSKVGANRYRPRERYRTMTGKVKSRYVPRPVEIVPDEEA